MPEVGSSLLRALAEAAALVLPVQCSGCGRPDRSVCPTCAEALTSSPRLRRLTGGLPVLSGAAFEGSTARIIRAFKDDGRTDAAPALGAALRRTLHTALAAEPSARDIRVVPVPSTAAAFARRGYRPVRRILAAASVGAYPALTVARRMRDQADLGLLDRRVNTDHAFAVRADVARARCVLVDDVVTTGSSLEEARRALVEAGAEVIAAATIASTPLHVRSESADASAP